MSLRDAMERNLSSWMKKEGPEDDIVIATRIRLARNLAKLPFPVYADKSKLRQVLDLVSSMSDVLTTGLGRGQFNFMRMAEVDELERQVMVEKHLISPGHTENTINKGLLLSEQQDVSIMINEEDHIRLQVLMPGLQLEKAWELATMIDDLLESRLDYAFDDTIGYLTACPTNVGTGLRASVMLHLPALAWVKQLRRVLTSISQFGLVARGLYGEGSDSYGNIYQISNQVSLGHTEEEMIEHLANITAQIITSERQAREFLVKPERRLATEDQIYRAYGILANARSIGTKEALEMMSLVRLGIDLELLTNIDRKILKQLMVLTRAGHLQKFMGQNLPPAERDRLRASLIREKLKEANQ